MLVLTTRPLSDKPGDGDGDGDGGDAGDGAFRAIMKSCYRLCASVVRYRCVNSPQVGGRACRTHIELHFRVG